MGNFLDWASEQSDLGARSIALRLVSACIDWSWGASECPVALRQRAAAKEWITNARNVLHQTSPAAALELQCAAVELFAAAGNSSELSVVFNSSIPASVRLHAATSALRSVRRGQLQLSTSLLQHIATETCAAFDPERLEETPAILDALQKLLKPMPAVTEREQGVATRLKLSLRLRLCATLPSLFAQCPEKKYRDSAMRILQTSIVKAMRQSQLQQQPLIDYAVACFIHFLARLPAFVEEANSPVSAYPESTRIASFFVEALLRADQPKGSELASIVLRVTERVGHFIDKEDPTSDKVHRAAYVIKYVVEKRRPELGAINKALQGVPCGCMPKELFELGQVAPAGLRLESGQPESPADPDTPALTAPSHEDVPTPALSLLGSADLLAGAAEVRKVADAGPQNGQQSSPDPKRSSLLSSFHAASAGPRHPTSTRTAAVSTPQCASSVAPRRLSYSSSKPTVGRDGLGGQFASTPAMDTGAPVGEFLRTSPPLEPAYEAAKRRRTISPEP
jgi:hypothetical protein